MSEQPTDTSPDLLYSAKDGIAWITFNRPATRNAMTFAMYKELARRCAAINADESVQVVILRGAGDKAFVAGTDIAAFRAFSKPQDSLDYEALMDSVFDSLEDVRVPTIAAIQGACTGGGAGIAAACDLRLGAPSARFGFPIARTLGNTLSLRNFSRLAGLIGVAKSKDILMLARLMDADEMLRIGLVSEVTTEDGLYSRAEEMARTLQQHAPITLQTTKAALNLVLRHMQPEGTHEHVVRAYMSRDFKEGIEAFLGKRKPDWKGK